MTPRAEERVTYGQEFRFALLDARADTKITQQELADACGIGKASVSEWECGRGEPRPELVPVIARVLGCAFVVDVAGWRVL